MRADHGNLYTDNVIVRGVIVQLTDNNSITLFRYEGLGCFVRFIEIIVQLFSENDTLFHLHKYIFTRVAQRTWYEEQLTSKISWITEGNYHYVKRSWFLG